MRQQKPLEVRLQLVNWLLFLMKIVTNPSISLKYILNLAKLCRWKNPNTNTEYNPYIISNYGLWLELQTKILSSFGHFIGIRHYRWANLRVIIWLNWVLHLADFMSVFHPTEIIIMEQKSCSNIQNLRKSKVCWWKWLRSHYWEYIRIEMLVLDLLALINEWIDKF